LEAMDAVAPQSLSPCFFVMTIVYFLTIVSKPTKQIMDDVWAQIPNILNKP
jgi:hypothetical protein